MNCNLCRAYLRSERKCPGCRSREKRCGIKNCPTFRENKFKYCYLCKQFPCSRIKRLDKRYRTRYGMSMVENLEFIKKNGIKKFLSHEKKRWVTPEGIICVHDGKVYRFNP